ncbi:MAG: hypothetical protein ACQZ3N_10030 [cyanobacterium endosymbiont of Rhopalodia yunnanensis]
MANASEIKSTDLCKAMELVCTGENINYQGTNGSVNIDENENLVGIYDVWIIREDGITEVIDKINPVNGTEE